MPYLTMQTINKPGEYLLSNNIEHYEHPDLTKIVKLVTGYQTLRYPKSYYTHSNAYSIK